MSDDKVRDALVALADLEFASLQTCSAERLVQLRNRCEHLAAVVAMALANRSRVVPIKDGLDGPQAWDP